MDLSETYSIGTPAFTNCHTDMGVSFLKDIVPSKCALQVLKCYNIATTISSSMKCESFKAAYSYASIKLQRNLHDNNSTDKTECGHNLVSKAYKVSNHHLHHGEP